MTENINVRFVGSADFKGVSREIAAVNAQLAAMSKGLSAASRNADNMADVKWLSDFSKTMDNARLRLNSSIMALDDFGVKSIKVSDHVDTLTEKIRRQKLTVGDLVREHKSLKDVYRQQLANRQATVMEWSRNGDGSANVDVITRNRNALEFTKNLKNMRMEMGFYNHLLGVVSESTVKWGKNTQWAGRQLMVGISLPIAAAAAGTAAMAYEIDKGLTQIIKVYGDTATAANVSDTEIRTAAMNTAKYLAAAYGQSAKDSLEIQAQLAATGKTGMELQDATAQVTRARLLGELDLQDAMKATITLQSVYNMNSKDLGDAFNYMNSMENQTVLTMQDFVVGIPKVSGVIKEMGGDVRETGTLLAAMKIAGIDAAEGANAIKSVAFKVMAPNRGTKDMFASLTGKSFEETVKGEQDVTKRLILIGQAMKDLEPTDRVGLIAKMFGLYQGSKALSIIDQLTNGSEQMNRALEVSNATTEEWAQTADRELNKLQNSNWNKVQQIWQSLKIDLAQVGDSFLGMIVPVLQGVGKIVDGFNSLDEGTRAWIARLAVVAAAIGPLIMLAGLMGNLIGNVGKFTSFIANLGLRFKMLSDEEVVAAKVSRMARSATNDEATAYAILAKQIQNATAKMQEMTRARLMATGQHAELAAYDAAMAGAATKGGTTPLAGAAGAAGSIAEDSEKTRSRWSGISKYAIGFAAVGTVAATSMASESGTMLNNITNAALLAATISPLFRGTKAAAGVKGMVTPALEGVKTFASKGKAAIGGILTGVRTILPALTGVGIGFAAVGAAAVAAWYIISKNIEKSRQEMEDFGNSAKTYSEVIGFTYKDVSDSISVAGAKVADLNNKVDEFKKKNEGAVKILKQFSDLSEADKIQRAIAEGTKAALHGATPEQAYEAAKIALKVMGTAMTEQQMDVVFKANIDFGDTKAVIKKKMEDVQWMWNQAQKNMFEQGSSESMVRYFANDGRLNAASKQAIVNSTKEAMTLFNSAAEQDKPALQKKFMEMFDVSDDTLFQTLERKYSEKFQKMGIKSLADLKKVTSAGLLRAADPNNALMGSNGPAGGGWDKFREGADVISLTANEMNQLAAASDRADIVLKTLVDNTDGLTAEQKSQIKTMDDYKRIVFGTGRVIKDVTVASAEWDQWQKMVADSGIKVSDATKLARLNTLRFMAGMAPATSLAQGFADSLDEVANSASKVPSKVPILDQLGRGVPDAIPADTQAAMDSYKEIYTNAMGKIYSEADRIAQEKWNNAQQAISNRFDAARDRLEKEQTAAGKAFDLKTKNFDKIWDARMKAVGDKYDKQTEKIKAQIKAEEDAEAIRQKIFEAEQTRLSRLAQMQNSNVDLHSALASGNLDQAAKISNDMNANSTGWVMQDAAAASGDASAQRKDALNARIDALGKAEDREKAVLEARKAREKELLDAQKAAMDESFARRKKLLDQQEANEKAASQRSIDRDRRAMELRLDVLKAWVPRDQKEMNQHVAQLEKLYGDYGISLKGQSGEWSKTISAYLQNSIATARTKMSNDIGWQAMGRVVAENFAQGAFNMSLDQFINWIQTGNMPSGAGVGYKGGAVRNVKGKDGKTRLVYGGQGGLTQHEGGVLGRSASKRTGFAGNTLSNSEVQLTALMGESVLNRRATRNLGDDFINNVNRWGGLPPGYGVGGPTNVDGGFSSALAIAAMSQGFKAAMAQQGLNTANKAAAGMTGDGGLVVGGGVDTAVYPGGWVRPAQGPVTSPFGYRFHPVLKKWLLHSGTDIGAKMGSQIVASKGGTVAFTGPMGSYGNHTIISHGGGIATSYSHQSAIGVKTGQHVSTGQGIGRVGSTGRSTGPHLHFEYMKNGNKLNPNMIIPGLNVGGVVVREGLAKLHDEEAVLTKPLTQKLNDGIDKMDSQPPVQYNLTVNIEKVNGIDDLESAMTDVMKKVDSRIGVTKTIGGQRR